MARRLTPVRHRGKVSGMYYVLALFIAAIVLMFISRPASLVMLAIAVISGVLVMAYRLVLKVEGEEDASGDAGDDEDA